MRNGGFVFRLCIVRNHVLVRTVGIVDASANETPRNHVFRFTSKKTPYGNGHWKEIGLP